MKRPAPEQWRLDNLPGVKGTLFAAVCQSISAMVAALSVTRAVVADSRVAKIIVWRDDNLVYRCSYEPHQTFAYRGNVAIFAQRKQVEAWLKEWHPKLRKPDLFRSAAE